MRWTTSLLCLFLSWAAPALAQSAGAEKARHDLGWFGLGGGFGGAFIVEDGVIGWPIVQARVNVTPRIATEVTADFMVGATGLAGVYQLQAHFAADPPERPVTPFFTVGTIGYFETRRVPERRSTLPTGDKVVRPAHRYSELSHPFGFGGGGGVRARLARRVWLESGAQLWFMEGGPVLTFNVSTIVSLGPRR
jgi:hypothetical protein